MRLTAHASTLAPLEDVWDKLIDVPRWQDWCPSVSRSETDGPFEVGMRARVVQRNLRATVWTVDEVAADPGTGGDNDGGRTRMFSWSNKGWGFVMAAVYRVQRRDGSTYVDVTTTVSGPMRWAVAFIVRRPLPPLLQEQMEALCGAVEQSRTR